VNRLSVLHGDIHRAVERWWPEYPRWLAWAAK